MLSCAEEFGFAGKKLLVATALWKTKRELMARCIRFMRLQAGKTPSTGQPELPFFVSIVLI
jgi:hypothetical protein